MSVSTISENSAAAVIARFLKARGVEKPWYSQLFLRFGSMFWRQYLVAATDQRMLFIQYGGLLSGFASKKVAAWSNASTFRGLAPISSSIRERSKITTPARSSSSIAARTALSRSPVCSQMSGRGRK